MNYFKFPNLFLIPVVLYVLLFSQESYVQWETIDTGINDTYYSASEDLNGNIWFGTSNGFIKYDGEKFIKISNELYKVLKILADNEGRIWLGTKYGGLYIYNGSTLEHVENEYFDPLSRCYHIRGIALDKDGSVWVGTGGGLRHFKDNEWHSYHGTNYWEGLSDEHIEGVWVDSQGNKWIGGLELDPFLVKYDNNTWKLFTDTDNFPYTLPFSFLENTDGSIWFCTEGKTEGKTLGIYMYDGYQISDTNIHDFQAVSCAIDMEGYLWFFNFVLVDSKGNRWFGGNDKSYIVRLPSGKLSSTKLIPKREDNKITIKEEKIIISPNPVNLYATINYNTRENGIVSIDIYNVLGQKIKTLLPETERPPGEYSINWNGKDRNGTTVSSGIYLCLYRYNDKSKVVKFTVLK